MRPPRRFSVLVCAALLAGMPGAALAQGADPGFEDPLGGQTAPEPLTEGPLTDEPQIEPEPTDPPPPIGPGADEDTAPDGDAVLDDVPQDRDAAAGDELANTGLDARLFVALGAALLLTGLGLRLRTLPERF